MLTLPRRCLRTRRARGFTLVELMVTLVLMATLLALGVPSFPAWIRNGKLRAVGDSLQTGLRLAQAEALRRNRQVVFTLTNDKVTAENAASQTAVDNGNFWSLSTVAAYTGDTATFIESGVLSDVAEGVQITGPKSICFNAMGRQVENDSPGIAGADCDLPTSTPAVQNYDIGFANPQEGMDRRLRVTVSLGGQVRMCDRDKTLSSTAPDGCP